MSKKKSFAKKDTVYNTYKCRWCEKEKRESGFYRCSITNKSFICKNCIDHKFDELILKYDYNRAIFIVCHYLDIAYYEDIAKVVENENIGYYIRQLNLIQNTIDNFETSIIKNKSVEFTPPDYKYTETKHRLGAIIKDIEQLRDLF